MQIQETGDNTFQFKRKYACYTKNNYMEKKLLMTIILYQLKKQIKKILCS